MLVYAESPQLRAGRVTAYTGSLDSTVFGSRSGHTPLLLWLALTRLGAQGHRARAEAARTLAAYTVERLTGMGWHAWRHPHAFTVVLDPPPPAVVTAKWVVPDDGYRAHVITMPSIGRAQIDEFLFDLEAAAGTTPRPIVVSEHRDARVRIKDLA